MTTLEFQVQVQDLLPEVEERMRQQVRGYHPVLQSALEQLISSGGKRVRPTLALLTCSMLGVEHDVSINLAAAVEMLHTATLVHDDLIDGASLRRGRPTINAELSDAATILTGDFLFSQAAWLGSQVKSVAVMAMFARTLSTIVNGEIVQITERNTITNRKDYIQRIYAKTASMFELAAAAPTLIMKLEEKYYEPLRAYGYGIGMAFQMVDDVLDFSSDAATMGKPVASDLRMGLLTLPALIFLENNPGDERMVALQAGKQMTKDEMDALVDRIRASGAVQRAHEEAEEQVQDALDTLSALPAGTEREALKELGDYVVSRLH
jgi:geranylgeranyl pyrophosphate synthase